MNKTEHITTGTSEASHAPGGRKHQLLIVEDDLNLGFLLGRLSGRVRL